MVALSGGLCAAYMSCRPQAQALTNPDTGTEVFRQQSVDTALQPLCVFAGPAGTVCRVSYSFIPWTVLCIWASDGAIAGAKVQQLPVDKLQCKWEPGTPTGRPQAVLVSCGSFNPPTYMHLRMFEVAAQHMQQARLRP